MEITVLGPGAIGTLLGGLLSACGHDVTLVGRHDTGRNARPVRIIHPDGWLVTESLRQPHDGGNAAGGADAFLVTLGRHHLRTLRRPDFLRMVAGEAPVYLFNCDPAEAGRLGLPPERRRFGVTLTTAVKLQEREVELAGRKSVLIVEEHAAGRQIFSGLARHGFEVQEVDDAAPFMSSFFLFQLIFLPVALCNLTLPSFLASPEGRELARNILVEGFLTMEKAGQALATLPLMDPQDLLSRLEKKPASFSDNRDLPDRAYNTILQAFLRGRQLEIAFLNRRLVEMASSVGLHLVWNWRVVQKAGRVSSTGFYRDPAELLRSLQ
jgi:ketopantoate reductase